MDFSYNDTIQEAIFIKRTREPGTKREFGKTKQPPAEKQDENENIQSTSFTESTKAQELTETELEEIERAITELDTEIDADVSRSQGKIESLKKLKRNIALTKLWKKINPVKTSEEFLDMLKSLKGFYAKLRQKPNMGEKEIKPVKPGKDENMSTKPDLDYLKPDDNTSVNPFIGDLTPANDSVIPTDQPCSAPTNSDSPDMVKEPVNTKREIKKDYRKERSERLQQDKKSPEDERKMKELEQVSRVTGEIKEITTRINELNTQVNDLEENLESVIKENENNPAFDPEPLKDEIENKQIEIEMLRMKKDLKKMEIESLKGSPADDDNYDTEALDYTISREELEKTKTDDRHHKSRETVKQNLEFINNHPDDITKADRASKFTNDDKDMEISKSSQDLQELIEEKFD